MEDRICAELISGKQSENQVNYVGLCRDQVGNSLVLILSFLRLSVGFCNECTSSVCLAFLLDAVLMRLLLS